MQRGQEAHQALDGNVVEAFVVEENGDDRSRPWRGAPAAAGALA
jgi:hypothetical protein